jgi:diguanylate cyclase (GGDEF)-like protein
MTVTALLYVRAPRDPDSDWRVPTLDAISTLLALGALTWVYVIRGSSLSGASSPLVERLLQGGYPLLDFSMLLALLAARVADRRRITHRTFQLLATYVLLVFAADAFIGVGSYLISERAFAFFVAGILHGAALFTVGWAALSARDTLVDDLAQSVTLHRPVPAVPRRSALSRLRTVSVGLVFVMLLWEQVRTLGSGPATMSLEFALLMSSGVLGLIVLARQALTSRREHEILETYSRDLEHTVNSRTRQLEEANRSLSALARTDALTGLPNRRHFDSTLALSGAACRRAGVPLGLLLLDVDHFKKFNDRYGHQAGDDCLRLVATAIDSAVRRDSDSVARYGGEEFAVICSGTDLPGVERLADDIRRAIHTCAVPHEMSDVGDVVTISIGGASLDPNSDLSLDDLVGIADKALYTAKQGGRDRFAAATEEEAVRRDTGAS